MLIAHTPAVQAAAMPIIVTLAQGCCLGAVRCKGSSKPAMQMIRVRSPMALKCTRAALAIASGTARVCSQLE